MSLTESARAREFIKGIILADQHTPRVVESTDWKIIAKKITVVAAVYGMFFMMKRRFWPEKRNVCVSARLDSRRSSCRQSGDELCPICLEPPRNGVRPGCGHRLCASCLRRYCESLKRNVRSNCANGPPPCPLCRTPLVSVTLTYDQINLPSSYCTVDPETAQWIDEYNQRNGGNNVVTVEKTGTTSVVVKVLGNAMNFVKLLLASIVLGIYARSYNSKPFGIDLVVYSSFLVTALGMTLFVCLWFKCQEQVDLEPDDDD